MGRLSVFTSCISASISIIMMSRYVAADSWSVHPTERDKPRIGIIGAGIGGASTAYFLRELFGDHGAYIDIYEANVIGGRLATAKIAGREFETGGSVIHPRNKYVVDFMKILGLEKNNGKSSPFALYDGKKFDFQSSDYYAINTLKILWRYGLGPLKLNDFVEDMLSRFEKIYDLQRNGESYETVSDLLHAMSPEFVDYLTSTTYDGLRHNDVSEKVINELVAAALRVNYGQSTDVNLFVGSVSVAGASDDLFSIKGGNKQIPEHLLEMSNVKIFNNRVHSITLLDDAENFAYSVNYTVEDPDFNLRVEQSRLYDIVIIAAPQTSDMTYKIKYENFDRGINFFGHYHRTVCTLVHGELNYDYFKLEKRNNPYEILSITNETVFNSISVLESINRKKYSQGKVWKLFSERLLTNEELKELFTHIKDKKIVDWLAYPQYDTLKRSDAFVLHNRLFYVNAIEWAASAMEMSAIGAKNVAILSYKSWTNQKPPRKIDLKSGAGRNEL